MRFRLHHMMTKLAEKDREIERLYRAIQRIDGINDNPACFNSDINEVCDRILRPELVAAVKEKCVETVR